VHDRPGEAYRLLSNLASEKVYLYAFSATPCGLERTQLVLFPEDADLLTRAAEKLGLIVSGPQRALIVQGDDQLGALVDIHRKLSDARINVYASTGVTDGRKGYGYVIYVRPEDYEHAVTVLRATS
jgi:hypothetical protein